jgi:anti-sigma regulatory factor (Ser/Thr protein kinase)
MERRLHHMVATFDHRSVEIRRARHLVRRSLRSWGFDALVPALELAVSELVTNALVHGEGAIEIQLSAEDDQLRLEVVDHGRGRTPPALRRGPTGELGGWGLRMVEEVADAWGADSTDIETRVWMVKQAGDAGRPGDAATSGCRSGTASRKSCGACGPTRSTASN